MNHMSPIPGSKRPVTSFGMLARIIPKAMGIRRRGSASFATAMYKSAPAIPNITRFCHEICANPVELTNLRIASSIINPPKK